MFKVVKQSLYLGDKFIKAGEEVDIKDENLANHLLAMGDVVKVEGKVAKKEERDDGDEEAKQPAGSGASKGPVRPQR